MCVQLAMIGMETERRKWCQQGRIETILSYKESTTNASQEGDRAHPMGASFIRFEYYILVYLRDQAIQEDFRGLAIQYQLVNLTLKCRLVMILLDLWGSRPVSSANLI